MVLASKSHWDQFGGLDSWGSELTIYVCMLACACACVPVHVQAHVLGVFCIYAYVKSGLGLK